MADSPNTPPRPLLDAVERLHIATAWRSRLHLPHMMDEWGEKLIHVIDYGDEQECKTYLEWLIRLVEMVQAEPEKFDKAGRTSRALARAVGLLSQIVTYGEISDTLDPRTDEAIALGYTIDPLDAKDLMLSNIKCQMNILDKLKRGATETGYIDPMDLVNLQSGSQTITELAMCCEWRHVVNWTAVIQWLRKGWQNVKAPKKPRKPRNKKKPTDFKLP